MNEPVNGALVAMALQLIKSDDAHSTELDANGLVRVTRKCPLKVSRALLSTACDTTRNVSAVAP